MNFRNDWTKKNCKKYTDIVQKKKTLLSMDLDDLVFYFMFFSFVNKNNSKKKMSFYVYETVSLLTFHTVDIIRHKHKKIIN